MPSPIKISTQEVSSTASTIRTLNGQLDGLLKDITQQMTGLKSTYQSEAADAIQERFNATANKYFNQYQDIIKSYADFLEEVVVGGFEKIEDIIKTNANAF